MSDYFLPVLFSLIQILVLAGIGLLLRKVFKWDQNIFSSISKLVVNVTLPFMFFSRMSSMDKGNIVTGAIFPFYAFLILGLSFLLSLLMARLFKIPPALRKPYYALCSFSNSGYLPVALLDIFAVTMSKFNGFFEYPLPILYVGSYLLVYSPMLWSFGNYLVTGDSEPVRLRHFITLPVIGILSGIVFCLAGGGTIISDMSLPFHYIHAGLETTGSLTSPLILIVLGASIGELKFNKANFRQDLRFAITPMLIHYLILPGAFLLLLNKSDFIASLAPAILLVLFIELVLPPPANFSVMTKISGKNEREAALATLAGYAVYIVVLPLYLMMFFKYVRF